MRTTLMTRFLLIGWVALSVTATQAQEIRKTLHDYRWDRPFNYQPDDPFVRSKTFQRHTGHYGLFYNCDDEECKRYSPHICWKTHWESDVPNWMRPMERIRHEFCQVKQRISDGAGACANTRGCQCAQCQQVDQAHPSSCGCQHCAQATQPPAPAEGVRVAQQSTSRFVAPAGVQSEVASLSPRSGLISSRQAAALGKVPVMVEPTASPQAPGLMERLTLARKNASPAPPVLRHTGTGATGSQPAASTERSRWMR